MVISFATANALTASTVTYGTTEEALSSTATGTKVSYSATLYFPDLAAGWVSSPKSPAPRLSRLLT